MNKLRKIAFLLFVVNGAGYLFFVDQHYNESGWYVWTKYLVLVALCLAVLLYYISVEKVYVNLRLLALFYLVSFTIFSPVLVGGNFFRLIQYFIPVFSIFIFIDWDRATSKRYCLIIFWLTFVGVVYEYFILEGFERFHPTGYRAISIFVNPNNFGVSIVLLSSIAILKRYGSNLLILAAALFFVICSGSKTALVMWLVLFLGVFGSRGVFVFFALFVLSIFILLLASGLNFTELSNMWGYSFDSLMIRVSYFMEFLSGVDNWIFPVSDGSNYYVDNAFVQVWIDIGLVAAILLLLLMFYLIVFASGYRLLFLLFLLSALTTNILYITPVAYFFWLSVSDWVMSRGKKDSTYQKVFME